MDKFKLESNTVSETLVLPLNARAHCSLKYPTIFKDEGAEMLVEKIIELIGGLAKKSGNTSSEVKFVEIVF